MKDLKMEDILEKVKARNPNMPVDKIKAIIKEGCKNLTKQIKVGNDVQIKASKPGIYVSVYKPHSNKPES